MTHRLLLQATNGQLASLTPADLLWRTSGESTVDSNFGPQLRELGPVPAVHVDFLRFAATVFFCDRTVDRPREFRREFELNVPVSDPDSWNQHAEQLDGLLGVLTGDLWNVTFSEQPQLEADEPAAPPEGQLSVLFSGGADSMAGAVRAHAEQRQPIVVSHHDWQSVRGQQRKALREIAATLGFEPAAVSWRFRPNKIQVATGAELGSEPSRRSRSALFVALGTAVAAATKTALWVPENGFTSLNPPLTAERRGALSTRTTHPTVLAGLSEVLVAVGSAVEVINPFADMTKGQAFQQTRDQVGETAASRLLSSTNSCAKPQRLAGFAPDAQCGVCMGCLVRRAAFIAADITDRTEYIEEQLSAIDRAHWLSAERRRTYEAVRYRASVGFSEDDILDLGLPDDADLDDALRLANEGLAELAEVHVS
jgi:7-cyano-7-deazaguanine synthase in queuosine biosynthesis